MKKGVKPEMEITIECKGTINAGNLKIFFETLGSGHGIKVPYGLNAMEIRQRDEKKHRTLGEVREIIREYFKENAWKETGEIGQIEELGKDEDEECGKDETEECGKDETEECGKNEDEECGKDETEELGKGETEELGKDETEECGKDAESIALKIFDILAEAESDVHGTTPGKVHFHEVGEMENILDVCACALWAATLRIWHGTVNFISRWPIRTGRGTIRCAHGELPLPAPATRRILDSYGLKWVHGEEEKELITPTGAALLAALTY